MFLQKPWHVTNKLVKSYVGIALFIASHIFHDVAPVDIFHLFPVLSFNIIFNLLI